MRSHAHLRGVLAPFITVFAAACSDSGSSQQQLRARTVEELKDPETCNDCHQDHFTEWSGSMHAYASIDPVFRAMNARGQKETNGALGDFCVKCHAPMAVLTGATTDGLNLDGVDKKLQGITCYFCHNVEKVTDTHNNPLVLSNDDTMRGGFKSPRPYGAHKAEYSPLFDDLAAQAGLQSSQLCGSCHDIQVPGHFSGAPDDVKLEQTFAEWQSSVFAQPDAGFLRFNCAQCHMSNTPAGPIASPKEAHPPMPTRPTRHMHDFPAIDTALTEFPEKPAQMKAVLSFLSTEFRIQICADAPPSYRNGAGFTGSVAVILENLSAAHYMPSGASQDRRIWVELHAFKGGQEIKSYGVVPPGVAATTIPDTWILHDQASKADGTPAHMFWDVASLNGEQIIHVPTPTNPMDNQLTTKPFTGISQPDRVTVTLWVESIGLDVIDDMIGANAIDPTIRGTIPRFAIQLNNVNPAPTPSNTPVTFDWNADDAVAANVLTNGRLCLENTDTASLTVTPPAQQ